MPSQRSAAPRTTARVSSLATSRRASSRKARGSTSASIAAGQRRGPVDAGGEPRGRDPGGGLLGPAVGLGRPPDRLVHPLEGGDRVQAGRVGRHRPEAGRRPGGAQRGDDELEGLAHLGPERRSTRRMRDQGFVDGHQLAPAPGPGVGEGVDEAGVGRVRDEMHGELRRDVARGGRMPGEVGERAVDVGQRRPPSAIAVAEHDLRPRAPPCRGRKTKPPLALTESPVRSSANWRTSAWL